MQSKIRQSFFLLIIITLMVFILISNWSNIKNGFKKPELIISKVTLNNECSIISDAFVVVHHKTKRNYYFSNNLARIKLYENEMIRLAISPKYPDYIYNGDFYKAKPEITLTANCETDPRMNSIFKSMRDQFN